MFNIKGFIFLVTFLICFTSCNNTKCSEKLLFGEKSASFKSYYPKMDDTHEGLNYEKAAIGGLDTLENGYTDFQLRIWIIDTIFPVVGTLDNRQLLVIKKKENWSAHQILSTWEKKEDSGVIREKRIIQLEEPVDWSCFADSLYKLGIMTLKDESEDTGFVFRIHTPRILVEIANKSSYKFLTYTSPVTYSHEVKDAKKLADILAFLERQLSFKRIAVY